MEILRYALGVKFDTTKFPCGDFMYHAFQLICSALSYAELNGVKIHGGFPYEDEPDIYLVVFEAYDFKQVRRIFKLLDQDTALKMFLTDDMPFIDKNRLISVQNMIPYGSYDYVYCKLANAPKSVYGIEPSKTRALMKGRAFKFLFAPDSFKGSISSENAIRMLTLAARETHYRGCDIIPIPIADGGEGTLEAVCAAVGGEFIRTRVHNPLGKEIDAEYAVINSDTALIEIAQSSGITLIPNEQLNVMDSSSYGAGELIMHAINNGYRKITVALGGSATNDGGMGCAAAMGVRFLDKDGIEIAPCGRNMVYVKSIDTSYVPLEVRSTKFTVMCDVDNPLTGRNGATAVFGPQKGADAQMVSELELGMKNLRQYYNNAAGYNICDANGSGAAGGMGAMLAALFKASMKHGIDTVLDLAGFDSKLNNISLIVTGEGCFDEQTLNGNKVVAGIINRTKSKVPVAVLCGSASENAISNLTNVGVIPIAHSFINKEEAMQNANELFYSAASNMFTLLKSGYNMKKK